MIFEVVLNLFFLVFSSAINLLPAGSALPSDISSALSSFSSYFSMANSFLPVSTLFSIVALGITFEAGILIFKFVNWSINKLRGSG